MLKLAKGTLASFFHNIQADVVISLFQLLIQNKNIACFFSDITCLFKAFH